MLHHFLSKTTFRKILALEHRRYAQYTEGIETEAKTKQLEQLIIEE